MRVAMMIAAAVFLGAAPGALGAAARQPNKGAQQGGGAEKAKNGTSAGGASTSASAAANYDPFQAAKDVEVGTFYMHKGDPDAAIDRFKDAVKLRPDWAEPRKLLGECYEKKHDKETALRYYKEYLKVFPNPTDRKKIEKKIARLSKG